MNIKQKHLSPVRDSHQKITWQGLDNLSYKDLNLGAEDDILPQSLGLDIENEDEQYASVLKKFDKRAGKKKDIAKSTPLLLKPVRGKYQGGGPHYVYAKDRQSKNLPSIGIYLLYIHR